MTHNPAPMFVIHLGELDFVTIVSSGDTSVYAMRPVQHRYVIVAQLNVRCNVAFK